MLEDPLGTMIRFIDDFMYISTSRQKVQNFLEIMAIGDTDYGCLVNPEKTLVNFDVTVGGHVVPRVAGDPRRGAPGTPKQGWFPWCGLEIATMTLDIRGDYSRYLGRSTICAPRNSLLC